MKTTRQDKFTEWIACHQGIVLKTSRLFAATQHDQEDLCQEILLQVWRSMDGFREEAKPSTWIYRVALNTALLWRRREGAQPSADSVKEQDNVADRGPGPAEQADRRDKLDWLYAELRKFDEVDRSVVMLYLDGVSYQEMAEILGLSESNIGAKLTRIRQRLRELAQQQQGVLP